MPKNLYFSQDEYERRWKAVYDSMDEKGYETAVIWGKTAGNYERHGDLLYLTNYYSNLSGHSLDVEGHQQARSYGAVILHRGQEPELIMDMPSFDMDQLAVDKVEGHRDPIFGVTEALKRLGVEGRAALIGTDFLPMKYAKQMEDQTPAIEWVGEDELVREVRQIKSPPEIELYRNAGQTMTEAISALMDALIKGKTEAEAAADAAYIITKAGGRFHMIPVSHGDSIYYFTRSPISGFSLDGAEPGDMVRGWVYGAVYQGYWMDPGRTAVAGRAPTPDQKELIESCYGIVDGIIKAIKPGVRVDEVVKSRCRPHGKGRHRGKPARRNVPPLRPRPRPFLGAALPAHRPGDRRSPPRKHDPRRRGLPLQDGRRCRRLRRQHPHNLRRRRNPDPRPTSLVVTPTRTGTGVPLALSPVEGSTERNGGGRSSHPLPPNPTPCYNVGFTGH